MCSDRPRRRIAARTRLDGFRRNRLRAAGPWSWPGPRGGRPKAPPPSFVDPERPGGSFRQPLRYGPPPGSPRDTGPLPTANRPEGAWSQQPGWQRRRATRPAGQGAPPLPPSGAPAGQPWPPHGYGPEAVAPPPPSPPASYADRIRADDLVPARRVQPGRGWRLALYKATFGLVNLGQSPDEIRAGRVGAQDQVGAARALQGRRDGQGRRREDDRVGQCRVGVRRAAPGRPGGGRRRRHRIRQARQPGRPEGTGVLLGAGVRPVPRDVRRRAQPGG